MPDTHGPLRNNRFLLEIDGVARAGFSTATLPSNSTEVVEYREGNEKRPTPRKLSGLNSYENLTLEGGTARDAMALFEWRKLVEDGKVDDARTTIAVVLYDEEGSPSARWEFRNAWPSNYDAPDLDGTANEVAIESVEIVHEGMQRVQ
ncbi:phage tail protein [Salinigranum sp. GCM10025319]|jgi:phage tail-like protein|uniref:phage tail protein n=1 Tax=Salinigranum sp. GCM10025319 TaxID=3252687 RepID=UPI00362425B2